MSTKHSNVAKRCYVLSCSQNNASKKRTLHKTRFFWLPEAGYKLPLATSNSDSCIPPMAVLGVKPWEYRRISIAAYAKCKFLRTVAL